MHSFTQPHSCIHSFTHSVIHSFTSHTWVEKLRIALKEIRYTLHRMVINPSALKVKYSQRAV